MCNKIIFLDFDGCVTDYHSEYGSYLTHEPDFYGPSEICVQRLRNLCEQTGAKIVISSNWRKFDDHGEGGSWKVKNMNKIVHNPLSKLYNMIGDLIIETLPKNIRYENKASAVVHWITANEFNGKYVIFDDDPREQY